MQTAESSTAATVATTGTADAAAQPQASVEESNANKRKFDSVEGDSNDAQQENNEGPAAKKRRYVPIICQ